MNILILLLLSSSVLFANVLADNTAAPYELLHYYYVYKLEWDTNIEKTIAPGCAAKHGDRMCYFDEFAKYLIDPDWAKTYRPTADDHTTEPGTDEAKSLFTGMPSSVRYDVGKLLPGTIIESQRQFHLVFETVLSAANKALAQDNVSKDDLEQALEWAQQVKTARQARVLGLQDEELEDLLGNDYQWVAKTGSDFNWDKTFQQIDAGVKANQLSADSAAALKETIRSFSLKYMSDISGGVISDQNHLNIIRALATSITSLTQGIEDRFPPSSSGDSSPRAPSGGGLSECEVEFGYDTTSSSSGSE